MRPEVPVRFPKFDAIAKAMFAASAELGVPIRWGATGTATASRVSAARRTALIGSWRDEGSVPHPDRRWLARRRLSGARLILLTMCVADDRQRAADRTRQEEAGQTLAEGRTAAAQDASAIRDRADACDQSTNDLSRSNRDAILSSPGADVRLDPRLDDAARRAICLRQSARDDLQCRAMLNADP